MGMEDPNFWYKAAMQNVKMVVNAGTQPSVGELMRLAKLEQLYRIANALEKPEKLVATELDNLIWARVAWIDKHDPTKSKKYRVKARLYIDDWESGRHGLDLVSAAISDIFNEVQGLVREKT